MKPSILLRLIVSLVIVAAFVLGATYALASNSLNPTALWWAQRQLPVLWMVDGFALLALLPVFGSAILQTRLSRRTEELAAARNEHQTQMEDMVQHTNKTERINLNQAKSVEALEATVAALNARLDALDAANQARQEGLDAANKAHQERMEAEMRKMAVDAFAALANEVQANTRQMDAVSLAMQYQRAEIKQLRQNARATPRSQEPAEIARLTPYELAALRGEDSPLLLEDGEEEKEKRRKGEEETEEGTGNREQGTAGNAERGMMNDEYNAESNSSLSTQHSSFSPSLIPNTQHLTPSIGFFEPTMNAQTTFVSPTTAFEIAPPISEMTPVFKEAEGREFSPAASPELGAGDEFTDNEFPEEEAFANAVVASQTPTPALPEEAKPLSNSAADAFSPVQEMPVSGDDFAVSPTAVTLTEYEALHEPQQTTSPQAEPQQTEAEHMEIHPKSSQQPEAPRGLRRWFMRL